MAAEDEKQATLYSSTGCASIDGVQSCLGNVVMKLDTRTCYDAPGSFLEKNFTRISVRYQVGKPTMWFLVMFIDTECARGDILDWVGPCQEATCCTTTLPLRINGTDTECFVVAGASPSPPPPSGGDGGGGLAIILIAVACGAALLAAVAVGGVFFWKRRRSGYEAMNS